MARYCSNCGSKIDDDIKFCARCGKKVEDMGDNTTTYSANNSQGTMNTSGQKSKLVAGLLGILLGSLGIHNFYLGNTNRGLTQLLVSLIGGMFTFGIASIAMGIWGLIEGIQILTGSINTDANGNPLGE